MKKIVVLLVIMLGFFACDPAVKQHKTSAEASQETAYAKLRQQLNGNWIGLDYIEALEKNNFNPGKVNTAACEELIFRPEDDSVLVHRVDMETVSFAFDTTGTGIVRVRNYNQDTFTDFHLSGANRDVLEFTYKQYNETWRFVKVPESYALQGSLGQGWSSAATLFFNEKMIAGQYTLAGDSVALLANGRIEGTNPQLPSGADSYHICLGGDCRDFAGNENLLYLFNSGQPQQIIEFFIWEKTEGQVHFYKVRNEAAPDEKPHYARAQRAFSLVKN